MVDVGAKPSTEREAVARSIVDLGEDLLRRLLEGRLPKGEALGVARLAGIQAAKETARLIPLCHQVPLTAVEVEIEPMDPGGGAAAGKLEIRAVARCVAGTGVEMEALTAASVAALTIYDMCKAVRKGIRIEAVELLSKRGGRSGEWVRGAPGTPAPE